MSDPTWERVAQQADGLPAGWRHHARSAHVDLIGRWVGRTDGRWLKTDLAEELYPDRALLPHLSGAWIGIDIAFGAMAKANVTPVQADVRALPFASDTFAGVVSTSTLDHFDDQSDIDRSIAELARVLEPGGSLIITFDNPANPLVALRNALPPNVRTRTRLVPFPVGHTLGAGELRGALARHGLAVEEVTYLLHAPHIVGTRLARFGWWERRVLPMFDRVGNKVTGHFVAAHARKPREHDVVPIDPARVKRPVHLFTATAAELLRTFGSERWDQQRRDAHALQALNELRDIACTHVPFYRERREAYPRLTSLTDLRLWPTMNKDDVRSLPIEDRLAGPAVHVRTMTTSGTTGQPLTVHYSGWGAWLQGVVAQRNAIGRRAWPWNRSAVTILLPDQRKQGRAVGFLRRRSIALSPQAPAHELAEQIARFRPRHIAGHGHLLIQIGRALDGRWRPRTISTFGEQLTDENRAALRAIYDVAPTDAYGTAEAGRVAEQCRYADVYHVNHTAVHVELLRDDGSPAAIGEPGEIVVSTPWNPLMPFLRYRSGDVAVWADRPCRCGRRDPAFREIRGRVLDWIIDADGNGVPPQRFWLPIHPIDGKTLATKRYAVFQRADGTVVLRVVPDTQFDDHVASGVLRLYRDLVGYPVELEVLDELPLDASGKFHQFRSEKARARSL